MESSTQTLLKVWLLGSKELDLVQNKTPIRIQEEYLLGGSSNKPRYAIFIYGTGGKLKSGT